MSRTFVTTIVLGTAKNVTGIVIPTEVLTALGPKKNPPVKVTLNGYTYQSTVATRGEQFMVPLSAENRHAAALQGDETLPVCIELDTEPRAARIPEDLELRLRSADLMDAFQRCSFTRQKEYVRQVESAKTDETRRRRIGKIVDELG
jgi:hypothetical protein